MWKDIRAKKPKEKYQPFVTFVILVSLCCGTGCGKERPAISYEEAFDKYVQAKLVSEYDGFVIQNANKNWEFLCNTVRTSKDRKSRIAAIVLFQFFRSPEAVSAALACEPYLTEQDRYNYYERLGFLGLQVPAFHDRIVQILKARVDAYEYDTNTAFKAAVASMQLRDPGIEGSLVNLLKSEKLSPSQREQLHKRMLFIGGAKLKKLVSEDVARSAK